MLGVVELLFGISWRDNVDPGEVAREGVGKGELRKLLVFLASQSQALE